jgi:hypothetical protein
MGEIETIRDSRFVALGLLLWGYPLVSCYSLLWKPWPIQFDDLAMKHGNFP